MLTRTRTSVLETPSTAPEIQKEIRDQVDERGFYLYNWISPDELRMSVQADYLSIVKWSSMPLMAVTLIAGFIGLSMGIPGVILSVLGVLGVFYSLVFVVLIMKMIRKSYLYTRGADVIVTDDHYVSVGKVLEKSDFKGQKEAFHTMEQIFREPLFEASRLREYVELEKKNLFEQLKDIAIGWSRIMKQLSRSRDAGRIVAVLLIVWVLYGGMMSLVYFLWVFFVAILARVFSWLADKSLLAMNNTEHTIQDLFAKITDASIGLKTEKKNSITLLTEAGRNEWAESLSSRLEESFELINEKAKIATENSLELSKLLEKSKYREIFNFVKYGNWMKSQVIAPIDEILELLEKHKYTLMSTLESLSTQILETRESSLLRPLELQKKRIEIQIENFDQMIDMMRWYQEKLLTK
jgi:hypothetical protein